jgi:uncharacterized protein YndB with AHSA1/START domain
MTAATLRIRRILPAPPERVFDAWTDPLSLAQWFVAGAAALETVELDPRVGGRFRIVARGATSTHVHWGEYLAVERPHRLAFTWHYGAWGDDVTTEVTVDLKPRGSGTELTLTHAQLPDQAAAAAHEEGWNNILEMLARYLMGGTG